MTRTHRIIATPRARRAIKQRGLDLAQIQGTGPGGRIVEADVLKQHLNPPVGQLKRSKMSVMRKTIARRLTESKQTIPHFYLQHSIAADALMAFYTQQKNCFPCSLNDILVKAVAMVLREMDAFRCQLKKDELLETGQVNIGIAVGLDEGLVVPVLVDADQLDLRSLAAESRRIIGLARHRQIENNGMGVFTISNMGMYGIDSFSAIINPPESGILAVGAIRQGSTGKIMTLTLSCDHRIIDGALAGRFVKRLEQILESPATTLANPATTSSDKIAIEIGSSATDYDVLVVGSGPGGYIAALQAAQMGARTAVIEKSAHLGGTCLNHGCIPSKVLLASAEMFYKMQRASEYGILIDGSVTPDWHAMQQRKNQIIASQRAGLRSLFKARQITLIPGMGKCDGKERVVVQHQDHQTAITANKLILATGSTPMRLPGWPDDPQRVATTDEILHWDTLPQSLLIVGGGVIGCELACLMNALGVAVTLVETQTTLLPDFDTDLATELNRVLKRRGVKIHLGVKVVDFALNESGCTATLSHGKTVTADRTLVAVGRKPNTSKLGLERIGVQTQNGFIPVNDAMQTSTAGVYCIGDSNGRCQLAHAASAQARIAVHHALTGILKKMTSIPFAVYTFPEIATAGITEKQAAQQGIPVTVGRYPFGHHGKALAAGETDGFAKAIRHTRTRELLGLQMIGHNATECIAAGLGTLGQKITAESFSQRVFAHPSMYESLCEAAEDSLGSALHLPPARQSTANF